MNCYNLLKKHLSIQDDDFEKLNTLKEVVQVINLLKNEIDEIQLKCNFIKGNIEHGMRQPF